MAIQGFHVSSMRQFSMPLYFLLAAEQTHDLQKIDEILSTSFEIDVEPYCGIALEHLAQEERGALEYAWRVAHLGRSLLQAVKIPCFEPGYIHRLERVEDTSASYRVGLMVPFVELISNALIETCYAQAVNLLAELCKEGLSADAIDTLFDALKTQFTDPLSKRIHGGRGTIALLYTAYQKNIPFSHLGHGIYQLGWGCQTRVFDRSSMDQDSAIGLRMTHNKSMASQIFRLNGLPTPDHQMVVSLEEAINVAKHIGFPAVIKPADRDRGEGVTVDIVNEAMIAEAFEKAAHFSRNVLVEKQIPGVVHRILVVNSRALYTVKRLPKLVVGDGIHTIQALIDHEIEKEKKKVKYKRFEPFVLDELAMKTIHKQGYDVNDVPDVGRLIALRPIESWEWGGCLKS